MVRLQHFGFAFVALTLMASIALGLGVRGGVRGAVVGGAFGNARAGAAIGATRQVLDGEGRARANYMATDAYRNGTYSNYNTEPVEWLGVPVSSCAPVDASEEVIQGKDEPAVIGEEVILRKDGTALLGVTYPAEWKRKADKRMVSAVSKDGHAWAAVGIMENAKDKQAGIDMIKKRIESSLKNIEFDKTAETKNGAIVVTGKGKGMKSGVNVVFAVATAELGKTPQVVAAAFVVDEAIEDHYKETVRHICETMRTGDALLKKGK
jgi:hypothetical protein